MARYPIKMLLDEGRNPFFPLVTIDTVLINGTDKTAADLFAERYTKTEVDNIIASLGTLQRLCGRVATVADLPVDPRPGDTYIVTDRSSEFMFIGDTWEELGPMLDLSGYDTSEQIDVKVNNAKDVAAADATTKANESLAQAKQYTDTSLNAIPANYYNKDEINNLIGAADAALTAIIEGGE